jgi:hypothetical protein
MSSPTDTLSRSPIRDLLARISDGPPLASDEIQELMAAAVRLYAARVDAEGPIAAFPANGGITATETLVTATAILKGSNLQLFELGMWQAWSGNI